MPDMIGEKLSLILLMSRSLKMSAKEYRRAKMMHTLFFSKHRIRIGRYLRQRHNQQYLHGIIHKIIELSLIIPTRILRAG